MMTIRTLIVDDEDIARRGLRRMLQAEPDVDVVGECSSGRDVAHTIRSLKPDLAFMDVEMPHMNSFDAIKDFDPAALPVMIFVTAYDGYAVQAFEVHAVDYLLKPFSQRRLREALDQARQRLRARQLVDLQHKVSELASRIPDDPPAASDEYLQRIPVRRRHQILFVDVDDIDWIEACVNYVKLHVDDDAHLVRTQISELEDRLPPNLFLRIHRSTIVNVERIRELHSRGSGDCDVVLHDGTHLRSSRTYRDRRRRLLNLSA